MPASGTVEHAGLDQAFRDSRAAWQRASAETRAAEQALAAARSVLSDRQERLAGLAKPEAAAGDLKAQAGGAEAALSALGPEVDIAALDGEIERLSMEAQACDADFLRLRDVWSDRSRDVAALHATLDEMLSDVPEDLRNRERLAERQTRAKRELTARVNAGEVAEKAAIAARETALRAEKDLEAATTALESATERQRRSAVMFETRLAEAGLSEENYRQLKGFFDTIEADRSRVEAYRRKIAAAEDAAVKAAALVAGLERPDVATLEIGRHEAEQRMRAAVESRTGAEHLLNQHIRLRDELVYALQKLDAAEAASGPLRNLAALVNGDNPQKLDLETFAIGAMFDQVLAAANIRLGPMTSHRYRLERDVEGGGRGRRGLGIQAFDSHTGKARPTATLSGGETFIAALALALGLADVVESASGKVRLDTIFIDEGFGSLDTENGSGTLDIVLQVLGALVSQNRAVGLISHVPLVQEAIPNGFYVRKHLTGSSVETRGVS